MRANLEGAMRKVRVKRGRPRVDKVIPMNENLETSIDSEAADEANETENQKRGRRMTPGQEARNLTHGRRCGRLDEGERRTRAAGACLDLRYWMVGAEDADNRCHAPDG